MELHLVCTPIIGVQGSHRASLAVYIFETITREIASFEPHIQRPGALLPKCNSIQDHAGMQVLRTA